MEQRVKMVNGEVVPMSPHDLAQMAIDAAVSAASPMPTITRRQLRLALLNRFGVTAAQVEAKIADMTGTPIEREAAMIEWQDATTYERNHRLVIALGAALGLTEAQIDAAWMEAATI